MSTSILYCVLRPHRRLFTLVKSLYGHDKHHVIVLSRITLSWIALCPAAMWSYYIYIIGPSSVSSVSGRAVLYYSRAIRHYPVWFERQLLLSKGSHEKFSSKILSVWAVDPQRSRTAGLEHEKPVCAEWDERMNVTPSKSQQRVSVGTRSEREPDSSSCGF